MIAPFGQVWVTSILLDEEVENAILLCYSLRRLASQRKVAIIVSKNISTNFRKEIYNAFDYVFSLDEALKDENVKLDEFVKVYLFVALQAFGSCVYLAPTMMAIRNCDNIFFERAGGVVRLPSDLGDTSSFMFQPSLQAFNTLVSQLKKGIDLYTCLNAETINKDNKCTKAGSNYSNPSKTGDMFIGNEREMNFVNLANYPENANSALLKTMGTFEKLILQYRKKLQREYTESISSCRSFTPKPGEYVQLAGRKNSKEPIAIVGMSCRYPGSNNLEEFWNVLFQGVDATSNPPPFRWLKEQCSKESTADCREVNAGFLKTPVDEFDMKFFGISPKEALIMDPQQRLLHEVVWEALEDACMNPHTLRGTSGVVFLGAWLQDYKHILEHSEDVGFFRSYMGNSFGSAAARISFLLGLTGPSIATESGCSSAMVAVHLACRSLQNEDTNIAFACGVNLLMNPFSKNFIPSLMSPDGKCKTFSESANGFGRAEGCGVLVLKRFSDAVRDGDRIWALIKGSAMTQEGISSSMGTPTVYCESLAMKEALADAKVEPEQVSYVEAHGTGTVVGDAIEISAIADVYHSAKRRGKLIIGSGKTNVGHTESCSGLAGIMKTALAMQHKCIPPHRMFSKLHPSLKLDDIPAILPTECMEWKVENNHSRIAGVNSFGITGTDAHVILEEAPANTHRLRSAITVSGLMTERPLHILRLSTKSKEAMKLLLEKFKNVAESSQESLADIAYSANTGRANFSIRTAIITKNNADLCDRIEHQKYVTREENEEGPGKICFLFTGQGSQYPGMAKQLYETCPVFRIHFENCEKILRKEHGISIIPVMWSGENNEQITRTIYSQTSIFGVEYALLKLWESWGVKPAYVLGHSLGEFAAAVSAGILSLRDAVKLVAERSKLIEQLPFGKMLAVRADKEQVNMLLRKFRAEDEKNTLDIAAVNSAEQTVIAGSSDIVLEFLNFCSENEIKCVILEATHAFHSKSMEPMLNAYRAVAEGCQYQKQNCEYISGMEGVLVKGEQIDANYWVRHTREKVSFLNASKAAVQLGCQTFIEIGPHPVLSAMTMMNASQVNLNLLFSLQRNADNWSTILTSLATLYVQGMDIDWNGFDSLWARKKVRLPHYPFLGKKIWPKMQNIQFKGNTIHPLVGYPIPNASSAKLFQSGINLTNEDYIKDHAIAGKIIFPGAGFLEMCLAAAFFSVQGCNDVVMSKFKPNRPVKLENLSITAPLLLEESKIHQLQTVVEHNLEKEGCFTTTSTVKVFHGNESDYTTKWIPHASATFSTNPTTDDLNIPFDILRFQQCLESPSDEQFVGQFYQRMFSLGYNFGPRFQNIEQLWWQQADQGSSVLTKVKVPYDVGSFDQYIAHPIILDAMLQSMLVFKMSEKRKLYLPVKIGKFIWMSLNVEKGATNHLYVSTFQANRIVENNGKSTNVSNSDDLASSLLVDHTGKVLALMTGVELIGTTVRAFESVLDQQKTAMPEMWEEVWCVEGPSISHQSVRLDCLESATEAVQKCHEDNNLERYNDRPDLMTFFSQQLYPFVYYNILKAMYECGWKPNVGQVFSEQQLMHQLGIQSQFSKQFHYILTVFEEEGLLKKNKNKSSSDTWWKMIERPPSLKQIETELASPQVTQDLVNKFRSTLLVSELGSYLGRILKGTHSALSILFPEENASEKGSDVSTVEDFYRDYQKLLDPDCASELRNQVWFNEYKRQLSQVDGGEEGGAVLQILEVGAGTGGYTEPIPAILEKLGIDFVYTYTDISSSFFPAAEKKFERFKKRMIFKTLNIEDDPISQGFVPGYYDIVCSYEVLHATRDLAETITNVKTLLKPSGFLNLWESTRVNRCVTYIFGLLDGYWRFEDAKIRGDHCIVSRNLWGDLLRAGGFRTVRGYPCSNDYVSNIRAIKAEEHQQLGIEIPFQKTKTWVIFHLEGNPISEYLNEAFTRLATGRMVITVRRGSKSEECTANSIILPKECSSEDDVVGVMKKVAERSNIVEGIVYCWSLEENHNISMEYMLQPYFFLVKSLQHLKQTSLPKLVALTSGTVPVGKSDLSNVHSSTIRGFTKALRNEYPNLKCKCIDVSGSNLHTRDSMLQIFYELWRFEKSAQVAFVERSRYVPKLIPHKAVNRELKVFDRFQLILPENKSIEDLQFGPLPSKVLTSGQIEIQVKSAALNFKDLMTILKPSDAFKRVPPVGSEFAGVVVGVGPNVAKWSFGDFVFGKQEQRALPSHVTLLEHEVLAIPPDMTFSEASTLPTAFCTAYSCLVDVAKITSSDTVLIHTASGGVGLIAIQICKHFGANMIATVGSKRKENYLRSLGIQHIFNSRNTDYEKEIFKTTNGKGVDLVLNSLTSPGFKEASLNACAQGARFVEMSKLSIWLPEHVQKLRPDVTYSIVDLAAMSIENWSRLLVNLEDFLNRQIIAPITYVRFNGRNIREALQYFQKAQHIGKIVCVMPEPRYKDAEIKFCSPLFNANATYLITGGLGGIGFEVCKWMVDKGAKYILLAGRSVASAHTLRAINNLNSEHNSKICAVQLDVSNYLQCEQLIHSTIPSMGYPHLRGIMHSAGILHDGMVENQTWKNWSSTFASKVKGTLNLHELTKNNSRLEHFVLFSSMASLFGMPGQSNHTVGNQFEDSMAHYRHSLGLPATTVNWGPWAEVGVATEASFPGVKPFSTAQAISALEYVLTSHRTQTAVLNVESFSLLSPLLPTLSSYIDEKAWNSSRIIKVPQASCLDPSNFWQQFQSTNKREKKVQLATKMLCRLLSQILQHDSQDNINDNLAFHELGVDSLMFVQIKNALQTILGDKAELNVEIVRQYNTVRRLSDVLVNLLEGNFTDVLTDHVTKPTLESVRDLIKEDCHLPEFIVAKPEQSTRLVNEVSCVLITGCTGVLGPYILKELVANPQITDIFCLIRPEKLLSGKARLLGVLNEKDLNDFDLNKVICIDGNIALPKLGMEAAVWKELSNKIEAIFHIAASVQHVERYMRQNSANSMRAVNVQGTKNVLEFSTTGSKLKHVFFASTVFAVAKTDNSGRFLEDWPNSDDFDNVTTLSYPITKFVGEILMKKAVLERGIPGKAFRFPIITGDSKTGRFVLDSNHVMHRFLFVLKHKIIPANPFPLPMLPVDLCASVSVKLCFDSCVPNDIYNIINTSPFVDQDFVEVADKLGYKVDIVEYAQFVKVLYKSSEQDSPFVIFKEFYTKDNFMKTMDFMAWLPKWVALKDLERKEFMISNKVQKYLPAFFFNQPSAAEHLYKDMLFAKKQGWL